jgi:hypothetical protein
MRIATGGLAEVGGLQMPNRIDWLTVQARIARRKNLS